MQSATSPIDQEDPRLQLRQALIDLEAAKARVERDATRVREETREQLIAELLPVLDNLDRSIAAGSPADPVVQGVAQVRTQLEGVLRGYGLRRFDVVGARFDPREHDAVAMTDVGQRERDGTVIAQLEAGYKTSRRLLRPAKVTVGRYQPTASPQPTPASPAPAPAPEPMQRRRSSTAPLRMWSAFDDWDPWSDLRRR